MTDTTALPAERLAGFPCWIELYTPDIDASARSTGTFSAGRSPLPNRASR